MDVMNHRCGSAYCGDRTSHRILMIGDDFFSAHGARTILSMLGFDALGPARGVEHAVQLITDDLPKAAILDIEHSRDFVFLLADILCAKCIPFGFVGSASLLSGVPERHYHRPFARKPYGINQMEQLLRGLGCVDTAKAPAQ